MFITKKKHKMILHEETKRFYEIGKRHGQNDKIRKDIKKLSSDFESWERFYNIIMAIQRQ